MRVCVIAKFVCLAGSFVASVGFSFQPESRVVLPDNQKTAHVYVGQRVIRPSLDQQMKQLSSIFKTQFSGLMQGDLLTGAPRIISLPNSNKLIHNFSISKELLSAKAKDYIVSNNEMFNLHDGEISLIEDSVLIADDIQSLSFQVNKDGLIIEDAKIIFHFKNGEIAQVLNSSFSEAVNGGIRSFDDSAFKKLAKAILLGQRVLESRQLYRVKENGQGGYVLMHVVEYTVDVMGVPYAIQLETETGHIYQVVSKHMHASGVAQATLYNRWYNEKIEAKPLKDLQIAANIYSSDNGEFSVASAPGPLTLQGKRVKVTDKGKKPINLVSTTRDDGLLAYLFERDPAAKASKKVSDDRITSQAMVYYHTTEVNKLAEKYIPQTKWLSGQLGANANVGGFLGLMSCNAYWDGRTINFYKGSGSCANAALIADVIYHEWGHGLDHNTGGIDDRAYSEGFGDIMAMLITRSPKLGIGFMLPKLEPVRDLEPNKIYPKDRGEVHAEGMIIGSTMWDLYEILMAKYGNDKSFDIMANYTFKMIYTASKYTEVYNALLAIDDNDGNLANGTPNFCDINKVFTAHGLAKADTAICN